MSERFPVNRKHDFFTSIYSTFNTNYNPETRIYHKPVANYDFAYKDDKLHYIPGNKADIEGALKIFPNISEQDINPSKRSVHDRISYNLGNRLVPGFNSLSFDEYKKEKTVLKKETTAPKNYLVDKWYFQKKDDTKSFYEKFFYEKEIDKLRVKNQKEKQDQKGNANSQK
mmetsp:Transcript_30438/g.31683  ORF Transcript_30438/g.31683 Transcript_30438/m.31683 type:complete len:170 (+) Transcript_30438:29-538(+)